MIDQEDKDRSRNVDQSSEFVKDMARLVDQRGPVIHELVKPLKERRLRNHFMEEARELFGDK